MAFADDHALDVMPVAIACRVWHLEVGRDSRQNKGHRSEYRQEMFQHGNLLLQIGLRSAKVDVERLPVDDQCGYRLHAVALGLSDTVLLLAQVDNFYRVPRRIECLDELLLGRYTLRATGMEKQGFAHD